MTKKLICALLALTMIFCTACSQADSSEKVHEESSSTAADLTEDSSESDPDHTVSEKSTETTTESSSVQTSETTKATTTTNATTSVSSSAATTTTKQAVATTRATVKPVQTTKATTKSTTKATTRATTKATTKAITKATQPAVNNNTYVNSIIADINKMFPESQFNRTLYDKFERLCKGIPTNDDLYQIKEQLCNFAMRKYNGKTGTIEYISDIYGENDSIIRRYTVTASKPISIKIDRTLGETDAHQNNGAMVNIYYTNYNTAKQNYEGISSFIKDCYSMADSGVPSLVKRYDNHRPEKNYNHSFYVFIGKGVYNYTVGHYDYYLWFCEG